MKKFRLPRKEKKSFREKLLLYPADEKGNSLMAQPDRLQKDYDAWRQGILRDLFDSKRAKEGSKEMSEKLDPEICIPDEQLREYVNDFFREDLRSSAFSTFIRAKNSKTAIKAYYNFVNAYHIYKTGEDSYGNICCLALDSAEALLRKENSIRRRK
ncbi:MAG: hypothetical protein RIF36_21815 [Imperialibacter sp.]|uniref:hypothetical protein n=1 Tax=Imperialibacter sp. TaxID=2038411 RepID=UPI0032EAA153